MNGCFTFLSLAGPPNLRGESGAFNVLPASPPVRAPSPAPGLGLFLTPGPIVPPGPVDGLDKFFLATPKNGISHHLPRKLLNGRVCSLAHQQFDFQDLLLNCESTFLFL